MKKLLQNKKFITILCLVVFGLILVGCQSNVDSEGHTLAERIISLDTPWKNVLDESIFSAIFVWPLAQCINFIGTKLGSAILGVVITTLLYNALTMSLSVKSTIQTQKMQLLQPELQYIQSKYEGRTDEGAKVAQAQEMQSLYKKHGINPLSSVLTPFLTLPIMIAMYYASQRAAVVCEGTLNGVALTTTPLEAFKNIKTMWPLALIFVIMALCQFASSKLPTILAENKKKKQKDYREYKDTKASNPQNNMMLYGMLAMIIFLGLKWPTSMSVYWAVSSIANILKTLFIQWRYIDHE